LDTVQPLPGRLISTVMGLDVRFPEERKCA
jgi:hypothetical protein